MRFARLGSRGPELSVVGFGAWEAGGDMWGPNPPVEEVVKAIRWGLDAGMNWIDTAEVYGSGTSEEIVGSALRDAGEGVYVATKVAPGPNGTGFAADDVPKACRASLQRLGVDVIDLYQLHWPDSSGVPIEETWQAMADLQDEGLVRYIGVSNFGRDLIERCEPIRHVDSLQPELSMLNQKNRDLVRWCGERGIGVVAYGPLAFGLLTGAITAANPPTDWRAGDSDVKALFGKGNLERSLAVTERLRPIAERRGLTTAQLALAWVVHQPGVTSAIAGSRNPEHVRENAAAGDIELDDATLHEVEEVLRLGPAATES